MFEGNLNDNDVVEITLPYPIVARYVRINPQRWTRFISLRAEFYGCRFGKLRKNATAAFHVTNLVKLLASVSRFYNCCIENLMTQSL